MEPMKKVIPTGTPSCELAPLRTTLIPFIQVRIPSAKGISSASLAPLSRSFLSGTLQAAEQPRRFRCYCDTP
jgi:hypothetical protein